METDQEDDRGLTAEMDTVRQLMTKVAEQLDAPLRPLVQSQIKQAEPLLRAGVVLAAAVNDAEDTQLRRHRIHLAAALEMLYVAHHIHKLLLLSRSDEMDAPVMGSTILAGDYCFSHAAMLAASTDSPDVVTIFAQALKTVSENNLKTLFGESEIDDEDRTLFMAGIQAAVVLAHLSPAQQEILTQQVDALSRRRQRDERPSVQPPSPHSPRMSEVQQQRWHQLFILAA